MNYERHLSLHRQIYGGRNMLEMKREISFTGESTFDGVVAARYTAKISSDDPNDIKMSNYQVDRSLYKENRKVCNQDKIEFEYMVYAEQDKMITEQEGVEQ